MIGAHPSAFLAAALLGDGTPGRSVLHLISKHATTADRLTLINPAIRALSPKLKPLIESLDEAPVHGLTLIGSDVPQRQDCVESSPSAWVASTRVIREAFARLAGKSGTKPRGYDTLEVLQVDGQGVRLRVDRTIVQSRLVILSDAIESAAHQALGLPIGWECGVMRRYAWSTLPAGTAIRNPAVATLPMSLDLDGTGVWAWLLRGADRVELAVESDTSGPPAQQLIARWAGVLYRQGLLESAVIGARAHEVELPLTGALDREGVGSRTLLIGPVGGFISGCAEELYPSCWSAVHAAECAMAALDADHPQDALRDYRARWGSTLGDYLRGPRNNLRYLLPLAFRNQTLAQRLADAIFRGQSVVR